MCDKLGPQSLQAGATLKVNSSRRVLFILAVAADNVPRRFISIAMIGDNRVVPWVRLVMGLLL
jgi:hypothetical protein